MVESIDFKKIIIHLSCQNFKKLDLMLKSDPKFDFSSIE